MFSHLAGLEPATFRLTAERANRLRHKCLSVWQQSRFCHPHVQPCTCGLFHVDQGVLTLPPEDYFPSHSLTCTYSPLAVAMFDYEAFGEEEDNLEFEEGDLIEVSEMKKG